MHSITMVTLMLTVFLLRDAFAQSVVQLTPVKDNTLYEDLGGSLSNGAGDHFFAGRTTGLLGAPLIRRGLLAFNIADSITAGSTIDSVVLRLHMSRTNFVAGPRTVELRRVLSNWGEGASHAVLQEGQGAPAMPNDATWIHTFFNTNFWSTPGGDFSNTASASQSVSNIGFYTWGSTSQMVADVQDWLDNPTTNFGWLVLGDESSPTTTKRFDSRQNPVEADRPVLTVAYTGVVSIEEPREDFPFDFSISQNYPNPFNPVTTIRYSLPNGLHVILEIHDNLGRKIKTLVHERQGSGTHQVQWDGTNEEGREVATGVYVYRLRTESFVETRKMVLLR
ncbi:MAG: DNRLRE domain-containing protein [Ignavibacteria bacterium]|nr:DNRLRE domain-containing protein [Ignavibacteria bacterium]